MRKNFSQPKDVILRLDSDGKIIKRKELSPWLVVSDSVLDYDPVGDQLLITIRNKNSRISKAALIDVDDLAITTLQKKTRTSRWLPAGAVLKVPGI